MRNSILKTLLKNLFLNIKMSLTKIFISLHRVTIMVTTPNFFSGFQLSRELQVPMVATNDVHYNHPHRRELQDIVTCIREKCTIYNAGYRLHPNAERYLKSSPEMLRLFRQYPGAIGKTQELAEAC